MHSPGTVFRAPPKKGIPSISVGVGGGESSKRASRGSCACRRLCQIKWVTFSTVLFCLCVHSSAAQTWMHWWWMLLSGVLLTISEHCLGPLLEHEYRKKGGRWKPFGFLCPQEALMLTSRPGQSHETVNDLSCNLSGTCNIHNNSPESFACYLSFRFPRLPASGEVLGTPKAGVTPPSPPLQCFLSCVSCIVTYCQPVKSLGWFP